MIVWVNGPFGVGKTTVSHALACRLPGAHVVNVEKVETMVCAVIPADVPTTDFQDDPVWRITAGTVVGSVADRSRGPTIVPMTVVEAHYLEEILGSLRSGHDVRHVTLTVPSARPQAEDPRALAEWAGLAPLPPAAGRPVPDGARQAGLRNSPRRVRARGRSCQAPGAPPARVGAPGTSFGLSGEIVRSTQQPECSADAAKHRSPSRPLGGARSSAPTVRRWGQRV